MTRPTKVYDTVRRQLAEAPDRVALKYDDQEWTWREFDNRVRSLAAALKARGIGPGDRVATVDRNAPASLELTFAVSLIGAVHAIMNFRLTRTELDYLIGDGEIRLLFTSDDYLEVLADIDTTCPTVRDVIRVGGANDTYEALVAGAEPLADADIQECDDHEAVIQLYTSGTTGHPKGALLTHFSLGAHTAGVGPSYDMDTTTVNGVPMPLFHVGGTCWALGSMNVGGETIILRDPSPDAILAAVPRYGITHIFLVPAVIAGVLANPNAAEAFATLRVLAYGGSIMPEPLVRSACSTLNSGLFSVYGMTEMSGVFCVLRDEEHRDEARPELLRSVGKPIPGNEIRIVEPVTLATQPPGETGEVWVRSEQQFAGYWRQPEASAETIVDGWLRTGDAGRMTDDGYVFLQDRVKDMLISGGENVYPAEIERVLIGHDSVAEVAVVGAPHAKWGETPVAFVVAKDGAPIDGDSLIEFSREHLAAFKTPTQVIAVDALPRNAMGKILKRELRQQIAATEAP